MSAKMRSFCKLCVAVAIFCVLSTSSMVMHGQTAATQTAATQPAWSVDDWTHHHVIFSNPGTLSDAAKNGTLDEWFRITNDPRYQLQQLKRGSAPQAPAAASGQAVVNGPITVSSGTSQGKAPQPPQPVKKDWTQNLGAGVPATQIGVVTTNNASSSSIVSVGGKPFDGSAPVAATQTGTFSKAPTTGAAITVTNGSNVLSLTTNATASNAIGTFAATPPLSSTSISVTSGTNTLVMTPNGTGSNAVGTFAGAPLAGTSIAVTSGSNTLNMTTNATTGSDIGTFNGPPLGSTSLAFTSGSNNVTMTPGGSGSTLVGTAAGTPAANTTVSLTSQSNVLVLSNGGTGANAIGTLTGTAPAANTTVTVINGANTHTMTNSGTAANAIGTFSGTNPTSSTTVTVANGANTLTLTNGGTGAFATGTFTGMPTTTPATSMSVTNGSNTLKVTTNATSGGNTGTFSAKPTAGDTITIISGINTLVLTAAAGNTTGTLTVTGRPAITDTITVGGQGYTFSSTCAAAFCISRVTGGSNLQYAENIAAALMANSALCGTASPCYGTGTTANTTVTAAATTSGANGLVTMTNATLSTVAYSETSSVITAGTSPIAAPTNSTCSNTSTAGTFVIGSVANGAASNLASAINTCHTGNALVGATAVASTNTVTVTESALGLGTYTETSAAFSWGTATGSNGTYTCTSSTAATFVLANTTGGLATNLANAIANCNTSFPAVGATAGVGGSVVTVTDTTPGTFSTISVSDANVTNIFTGWASVTAGTNGSNACSSATAGTYAASNAAGTLASNVTAAINACSPSFPAVGATASYTSGSTFTVADSTPGSFTTITVGGANISGILSWGGVTAGTNGSPACSSATSGTYATSNVAGTLASNLAAAINACSPSFPAVGATASYTSGSTFTVTDSTPGAFTTITVGGANISGILSWGGVTAGTNGSSACTTSIAGTYATSNVIGTLASNISAAINACNTANAVVGATSLYTSGATFTVTDAYPGSGTTFSGAVANAGGIFSWATGATGTNGSSACSGTAPTFAGTFAASTAPNTLAGNLNTALAGCTSGAGFSTATATNTVTITETIPGQNTFSVTNGAGIFAWGTGTAGTNGSATCPSSTTGTYATSNATATLASNLSAAINACNTSFAAVGATAAYTSGNTFTVTNTIPGSFPTFSVSGGAGGIFAWGSVTPGGNGSTSCAGTTGTFITDSSANNLAINLAAAINACPTTSGVSAISSTNTVTVSDRTPGNATTSPFSVTAANNAGIYTWGTATIGNNGTSGCSGSAPSYSGTYVTSNSTTTLAGDLNTTIGACPTAFGISSATSTNTVTVTARTAGSGGNSIDLASSGSFFTWPSGTLTGGSDGTTDSSHFAYWSGSAAATQAQVAANIATAINDNGTTGTTAVANQLVSGDVTVYANTLGTGGNGIATPAPTSFTGFAWNGASTAGGGTSTVQPNTYPAKYSFSTGTANCLSDFLVYPTGVPGTTIAANIIAFNNLYVGTNACEAANPTVYWAYNTGGMVTTSPIFSYDAAGSQVAYIQVSGTTPTASLVLLKWAANPSDSMTGPENLTVQASAAAYQSCAAPCFYTLPLSANDSFSAPFYDYNSDSLYVGDDNGILHKFTGVFTGTPTAAGSPWPVTLNASNKVSSPVYDISSNRVFVGDLGGILWSVPAISGTVYNTTSLGDVIVDAPLVDSTVGSVNVFVTTSGSAPKCNVTNGCPYAGDNVAVDFSTGFTAYGSPGTVYIGAGTANYYLYAGSFDNVYFQSPTHTGNIYVIGNTHTVGGATLYQVVVSGGYFTGASNTPLGAGVTLNAATYPWPSPATEFCNPGSNAACALNPQRSVAGTLSATNTTASPGVTLTSGTFTQADVGSVISDSTTPANIPAGDTIASLVGTAPTTKALLAAAPTTAGTSQSLTIAGGNSTTTGTDYLFFSVSGAKVAGCPGGAGFGCAISYNISNPSAPTTTSSSGLIAITPVTNGCWASGGIIVDNSVPATTQVGASEIYFVELNGNAASGPTGIAQTSTVCTAGTGNILNATQASQAAP